jgi:hypothetical protein
MRLLGVDAGAGDAAAMEVMGDITADAVITLDVAVAADVAVMDTTVVTT